MPNAYRSLLDILPQRPLLVGTVTTIDGDMRVVTLPGGGTVRARGDAALSDRVFVRDNVIEGPAPLLTLVSIEV